MTKINETKNDWDTDVLDFNREYLNLVHDPLQFSHNSQMIAEFTVEQDRTFILYNNYGQDLVTVNLDNGDITYGETYTPDEAARTFWEMIGKFNNQFDSNMSYSEYAQQTPESENAIDRSKEEQSEAVAAFDDSMKGLV